MKRNTVIYIMVGFCIAFILALVTTVTLVLTGVLKDKNKDADITIHTSSAYKEYDGTPLTCSDWYYSGELKDGHVIECEPTGSQTQIGWSYNYAVVSITDVYGNSVMDEYVISYDYGILAVSINVSSGMGGGQSSGSSGGALTEDQQDITGGVSEGELNDLDKIDVLKLYSDYDGNVYLRYKSYGDYNGRGFDEATPYYGNQSGVFNPTANLIDGEEYSLSVNVLSQSGQYYLPYYTTDSLYLNGDVKVPLNDSEYTVNFKTLDYFSQALNGTQSLNDYNAFVNENYLTINTGLKSNLLSLTRFSGNRLQIAESIVNYVKNSATYNASAPAYPDGDMVLYFLTERMEGKCSDFAAAATMLFRAYGFPARYTTGFVANLVSGKFVYVSASDAHAWVEVYVADVGWICVEVTGGSFNPDDAGEVRDVTEQGGSDEGNTGGALNEDQSGLADQGGTGSQSQSTVMFTLQSNYTGKIYLRYKSYSYYTGRGFESYLAYDRKGDYDVFNHTVRSINGSTYSAYVRFTSQSTQYYLPYYSPDYFDLKDDVEIPYSGDEYTVNFKPYDYLTQSFSGYTNLSDYNLFVKEHYLLIDGSLKNQLKNLSGKFSTSGKRLVNDIVNYIKSVATYSLDCPSYPDGEDMVTYFLSTRRQGKCSDFAAAATMLFRAYGIPARYTIGYTADVTAYDTVSVKSGDAHAWVEIYINNVGWVYVDATPSAEEQQRVIKIVSDDVNHDYSGERFYVNPNDVSITVSNLRDEDRLIISTWNLPYVRNVGDKILNCPKYYIIDGSGNDVTDLYVADTEDCGYLTVSLRTIKLITETAEKTYDGTPLYGGYTLIEGSLVSGHAFSPAEITEPGEILNAPKIITTGSGKNVSGLYNIVYESRGTLTVSRIKLIVQSDDKTKYYDGTPLAGVSTVTGLLSGHIINKTEASLTAVGTAINVPGIEISDGDKDVSAYYDLDTSLCGTLEILPREIIVISSDVVRQYDGNTVSVNPAEVDVILTDHGDGFTAFINPLSPYPSVTEPGQIDNCYNFTVSDINGNDITAQYTVDYSSCGTITITALSLTLKTESQSKVYDGTPLVGEYLIIDGSLLTGHAISPATLTTVGEILNTPTIIDLSTDENVGNLYEITYDGEVGRLTVFARNIKVVSANVEREYDGNLLTVNPDDVTIDLSDFGDNYDDYSIVVTSLPSVLLPNEQDINCPEFYVVDKFGEIVPDDTYVVDLSDCGYIKITPVLLTVASDSAEKLYDGTPLVGGGYVITGNIIEGQIIVPVEKSITSPSESGKNIPGIKITDLNGNDITSEYADCYTLYDTEGCGTLVVKKRVIFVTSDTLSKPYDGTPLVGTYTLVGDGILADRHYLTVLTSEITEIGTVENLPVITVKSIAGDNDVTGYYYDVVYGDLGTLTVYQPKVKIYASSGDTVTTYGEQPSLNAESVIFDTSTLKSGHYIAERYYANVDLSKVGEYVNCPVIVVKDADGNVVSDEYEIDASACGRIKVLPRSITVETQSLIKEYDGTPLTNGDAIINVVVGSLVDGDTITCEFVGSQTNPGSSQNVISGLRIYSGETDVTECYKVSYVYGTLTVTA